MLSDTDANTLTLSGHRIDKKILAIGGGKGGIGKSFISTNLAICLAHKGFDVIIVDLDLGGANLHTCMGTPPPTMSISDFIARRVDHLNDLLMPTPVRNLKMVSGFNDALNVANIGPETVERVAQSVRELKADYIILDLGAGTSENTLDFFLMAHKQIVSTTPEPTAIENAYRFIKAAFYRKLRSVEKNLRAGAIIEEAMDNKNRYGIRTPADLIHHLEAHYPDLAHKFNNALSQMHLSVIVNQVRTQSEFNLGESIRSVSQKYFGIPVEYLGAISYDNAVWQSLRKRRPLILEYPYSRVVGELSLIAKNLVDPAHLKAVG